MEEELLSTRQAAERLGITPSAVNQAIVKKTLPARRIGGRYVLNASDVAAYVVAPGSGTSEKKRESSRRNVATALATPRKILLDKQQEV